MRDPGALTALFRSRGLKVTPQRQLLFRLLHDDATHPSAEALYAIASREMPGISLRTVYQTLNDLASMGELHVLDVGTGSSRFDPNVDDHHHQVCDRCGSVHDVAVPGAATLGPSGERDGFTVQATHVVFRGLCAECARTSTRSTLHDTAHPRSARPRDGHHDKGSS